MNTASSQPFLTNGRRNFLIGTGVVAIGLATWQTVSKISQYPNGTISGGIIDVYVESFSSGKFTMIFFSKYGKKLKTIQMPMNWSKLSDKEKREWRTQQKTLLSKLHKIDTDDILVSSPYLVLENEEKDVTMVDQARENAKKTVINDPKKRSRANYISDIFGDFSDNEVLNGLMKDHIVGLVAGESRIQNNLISRSGALGVFQLMPWTITNSKLNPEKWNLDEVRLDLTKQCYIANRLFREDWKLINRDTQSIASMYFGGNKNDAVRYFMFPLLINTYNTGYPNIKRNLDDFMKKFPDLTTLKKAHRFISGYDIYWQYTRFGISNKNTPAYRDDAGMYFYKTLGMSQALKK